MKLKILPILAAFAAMLASGSEAQTTLRVGHFPNITHAQALVASLRMLPESAEF